MCRDPFPLSAFQHFSVSAGGLLWPRVHSGASGCPPLRLSSKRSPASNSKSKASPPTSPACSWLTCSDTPCGRPSYASTPKSPNRRPALPPSLTPSLPFFPFLPSLAPSSQPGTTSPLPRLRTPSQLSAGQTILAAPGLSNTAAYWLTCPGSQLDASTPEYPLPRPPLRSCPRPRAFHLG